MYYWIYAVLYVFMSIIIGQLLIEQNLRLIFYLIMLLLYASVNNIYFSIKYYIKLRNHKGIKGHRGDPGTGGSPGGNGTCVMNEKCGIVNCSKLIEDTLSEKFPEYRVILLKQKDNIQLNDTETQLFNHIETYKSILLPKCESFEIEGDKIVEFKKIIENTLKE
jgi:hypothetical protein